MADIVQATPINKEALQLADMQMPVRELDNMGQATVYMVPIPTSANFNEWSIYQQVAMLKAGSWAKSPVGMIVFASAYALRYGRKPDGTPIVDIMQGDVYTTGDGRIALSNKAKIKIALASGRLEDAPEITITETDDEIDLPGCSAGHDLECTVKLTVKGWKKPVVKTQRLSEWYVAKNPNWQGRPAHMLELNTLAHACELISPTETGPDEYPTTAAEPVIPSNDDDLIVQLKASVEATKKV